MTAIIRPDHVVEVMTDKGIRPVLVLELDYEDYDFMGRFIDLPVPLEITDASGSNVETVAFENIRKSSSWFGMDKVVGYESSYIQ